MEQYVRGLLWCMYVIAVIIAAEIFGYLWHRFAAHDEYLPGLHATHQEHHEQPLDAQHEADQDFVWMMLVFLLFELAAGVALMLGIMPGRLAIITVIVGALVLTWNWWLHRSYHQSDHWLNSFEWFRTEKQRHFVHHQHPDRNYGIASHFSDWALGTWLEAEM